MRYSPLNSPINLNNWRARSTLWKPTSTTLTRFFYLSTMERLLLRRMTRTDSPSSLERASVRLFLFLTKLSMWCNPDTGLSPELVVFAPLGCSIQTALHAFPYNSPDSVRGVSWVCRGDLLIESRGTGIFLNDYQKLSRNGLVSL